MLNENVKLAGFKACLVRFHYTKNKRVKQIPWEIATGGYNLDFEIYYNGIPVVQCIAGELKNGCLEENDFKKICRRVRTELNYVK